MTGEKNKQFRDLAAQAGLKKTTIDALLSEDYDSIDVLELMSTADVDELAISKGQRQLLQKWVSALSGTSSQEMTPPVVSAVTEPSTSASGEQRTNLDIHQLLGDGDSGDEQWVDQDNVSQSHGRPLFINDFLSRVMSHERERPVFSQGGTELIMRTTRQKPIPESVTLPQWISANARILSKMIRDGNMKSHDDILAYLQSNIDLGDYAQVNELSSIMVYDHEYRRKQSQTGQKLGQDDVHLANFYLVRKQDQYRPRPSNRPPRLVDQSGVEVCRNYNGNGCYRTHCVYAHVCAICKKGHPKRSHPRSNDGSHSGTVA